MNVCIHDFRHLTAVRVRSQPSKSEVFTAVAAPPAAGAVLSAALGPPAGCSSRPQAWPAHWQQHLLLAGPNPAPWQNTAVLRLSPTMTHRPPMGGDGVWAVFDIYTGACCAGRRLCVLLLRVFSASAAAARTGWSTKHTTARQAADSAPRSSGGSGRRGRRPHRDSTPLNAPRWRRHPADDETQGQRGRRRRRRRHGHWHGSTAPVCRLPVRSAAAPISSSGICCAARRRREALAADAGDLRRRSFGGGGGA